MRRNRLLAKLKQEELRYLNAQTISHYEFVLYWLAQSVFTVGQNLVTKKMVQDEIQENESEIPKKKRAKSNK